LVIDSLRRSGKLDLGKLAGNGLGQNADPATRVDEFRVVAELAIVEPDRAGDHVLELGQWDEALAPRARDLGRVDPPETRIVRNHEVPAYDFAEVGEAKLLEVLRLGRGRRVVGADKAEQALVRDGRRKAEGVRLERVARVDAVRPDG